MDCTVAPHFARRSLKAERRRANSTGPSFFMMRVMTVAFANPGNWLGNRVPTVSTRSE